MLGKSSGGFGAMHLVLEHPGVFAAFASHSGDSYFRYAHPPAFATVQRTLEAYDVDIGAFVERFRKQAQTQPTAEYTTMEMLAYAAAYSPRSAKAFDLDLPFDRAPASCARTSSRAGWPSIPAERVAGSTGRARAPALALPRLRPARRVQPRHRRARRRRSACASWASTCGTRNSTTTTATSDTGTQFRCRRWPPFWIRNERSAFIVAAFVVALAFAPLASRRRSRAADADARPARLYAIPAMTFTAPPDAVLVERQDRVARPSSARTCSPLRRGCCARAKKTRASIQLSMEAYRGAPDQWEGQFESQTHGSRDGTLIRDKTPMTLLNGMPAISSRCASGSGFDAQERVRGRVGRRSARHRALGDRARSATPAPDEAKRVLKQVTAVRYPIRPAVARAADARGRRRDRRASSMPTDRRRSPSVMPRRSRSSCGIEPCVMRAG